MRVPLSESEQENFASARYHAERKTHKRAAIEVRQRFWLFSICDAMLSSATCRDSLPEWSKGVDSSSTSASCVGSNPTAVIFCSNNFTGHTLLNKAINDGTNRGLQVHIGGQWLPSVSMASILCSVMHKQEHSIHNVVRERNTHVNAASTNSIQNLLSSACFGSLPSPSNANLDPAGFQLGLVWLKHCILESWK